MKNYLLTGLVAFSLNACASDYKISEKDVHIVPGADLKIMFHGNRFSVAGELITEFQKTNKIKISWTSLPPLNTVAALEMYGLTLKSLRAEGKLDPDMPDDFKPDLVTLPCVNLAVHPTKGTLYSHPHGIVAFSTKPFKLTDTPNTPYVLPGQATHHALVEGANKYLATLKEEPTIIKSQAKHHRDVVKLVANNPGSIGFQYLQSESYIKQQIPGVYIERLADNLLPPDFGEKENSCAFVTRLTSHGPTNKFMQFLTSETGQTILKKYNLQLN